MKQCGLYTFRPSGACYWLYQSGLYTFRLSETLEKHRSAVAECYTRIHNVDFGAEGVYRTRITENLSIGGAKCMGLNRVYITGKKREYP